MTLLDDPIAYEQQQRRKRKFDDGDFDVFWREHTPSLVHGLLDGNGWAYDPEQAIYQSDSGTRLYPDDIRHICLNFTKSVEDTMRADGHDVATGEITPDEFHKRMDDALDDELYLAAVLGAGGFDRLTAEDRRLMRGFTATETKPGIGLLYARQTLERFVDELKRPTGAGTEKQVVYRAGQYSINAYPVWQETRRATFGRDNDNRVNARGVKLVAWERNLLDLNADHCRSDKFTVGCPALTDLGWMPIGVMPAPGLRTCGAACRCALDHAVFPEGVDPNRHEPEEDLAKDA